MSLFLYSDGKKDNQQKSKINNLHYGHNEVDFESIFYNSKYQKENDNTLIKPIYNNKGEGRHSAPFPGYSDTVPGSPTSIFDNLHNAATSIPTCQYLHTSMLVPRYHHVSTLIPTCQSLLISNQAFRHVETLFVHGRNLVPSRPA